MAALARSVLRYSARHEAAASDSFADHVIAGLSDNPKWLSAKYFYDAAGSDLFEQITRLPEYYPTRTELEILERNARRDVGLYSARRRAGRVRHRLDQEGAHPARRRAADRRLCAGRYLGGISRAGGGRACGATCRGSRCFRSRPTSRATSICRRRSARARASDSSPARPSAISSRRTRRNFCARPARILGQRRDHDRRRRPHQGRGRAQRRL